MLWILFVIWVAAQLVVAADPPTYNIQYQVEQLNLKLDQLQRNIDLFEFYNASGMSIATRLKPEAKLHLPPSCKEAYDPKIGDGIYTIHLPDSGLEPFDVYCLKDADEVEPWTIFQRRVDDSVDFYRDWNTYKKGFGNLSGNFFIGLEKLHALTNKQKPQELWVKLKADKTVYAKYKEFAIGSEYEFYHMKTLGTYTGTAGDSLSYLRNMKFSTYDLDNDIDKRNCALLYHGAWWYQGCHYSHLNGVYGSMEFGKGVIWEKFRGFSTPMEYAHMAVRPSRVKK